MSRRLQENIVVGIILAIFSAYLIATLNFGPNARLVPLPIAMLGIVLVLIQLILQNLRDVEELQIDLFASLTGMQKESPAEEKKPPEKNPYQFRREVQAGIFVTIFTGLILLFGPVVAVFLFSSGFLALTHHFSPIKAVWISAVFSVALYLLFVVALQLQLYHGILEPLVAP